MHEGGAQPKSSCIRCTSCGHESRIISIHVSWQPLRPSLNRNFIKKIKACDKRFTWTVGRLASPGSSNTCRGHNLRQWPASIWIISPDIPEEIKIKKKKDRERKGISISDKSRKGHRVVQWNFSRAGDGELLHGPWSFSFAKNETRVNPMAPLGNAHDHRTKFTTCITLNVDKI